MLSNKDYEKLVKETSKIFDGAIKDNDIPSEMLYSLKEDTFIFSGLKTHAQLLEASKLLLTDDNKVKSFSQFSKDVENIKANYNQQYLEAEYQFALTSAQMAGKWANISSDYLLQYRTAMDNKVRESHQRLHNITLPVDDAFWIWFYPPNGWRCRCVALEVRRGKYDITDSKTAISEGEKATSQVGKDGKNKLEIFRFNPGREKVVFPPAHPYNKVEGAKQAKEILKSDFGFKINKPLKTHTDVSNTMADFAKVHPEYYAHGYKFTKATSKKGVNGYTTMSGDVYLTSERMVHLREGLNNIRNGKKTTLAQEDAISTLHHEMWHNANKPGYMRMTTAQTKTMELANEFVSRKTLPEFMKKLGGKLENEILINDRKSTGYNKMVRNYDLLVDWSKSDKTKVLETVKNHLVNGKYTDQLQGLVDGIRKNTEFDIKESTIRTLIGYAQDGTIDYEVFQKLLERNKELLVKKGN